MIQRTMRSHDPIPTGDAYDLINSKMPERISMRWNGHGSFTYREYKNDNGEMVLTREERDGWGLFLRAGFAVIPEGERYLWDNRERYAYAEE